MEVTSEGMFIEIIINNNNYYFVYVSAVNLVTVFYINFSFTEMYDYT